MSTQDAVYGLQLVDRQSERRPRRDGRGPFVGNNV